jgi:protein SCO1/2
VINPRNRKNKLSILLLSLFLFAAVESVSAQTPIMPQSTFDPETLKIDENKTLGTSLDKDYVLIDSTGKEFKLGELLGKPIILLLSYYSCDGVCPTVNKQLKNLLIGMEKVELGTDYGVLTVSFDKNDDLDSIRHFIEDVEIPADMNDAWKVTIMKNEADIKRLTSSLDFRYFWQRLDNMFFHPSVYIFISPLGRVMRYLYASSIDSKDMELAVLETSLENTAKAKVIDFVLSTCYSYNYEEGKYTLNYPLFISIASFFLGISLIVGAMVVFKKKVRR